MTIVCKILNALEMPIDEPAYVRDMPSNTLAEPKEVYIPDLNIWVRADGRWISGQGCRPPMRPNWFQRFVLRRAIKRWVPE